MTDGIAAIATPEPHSIELPNGVVLSGVGGDPDAIRDQAEDRQEERGSVAADVPTDPSAPEAPKESRSERRRKAQERIDEAIGKQRTAERERDELRQQLELAKRAPVTAAPAVEAAKAETPAKRAKPLEDEVGTKYATYADFVEDLSDWKAEQRLLSYDADLRTRNEAESASRTFQQHAMSIVERGRKAYSDFDAVRGNPDGGGFVQLGPTPEIHTAKVQQILSVPGAEHVLYQVCKDKSLANELAAIETPFALGLRLAQLMHTAEPVASAAPTRPAVPMTQAAPPMQPVGTSSRTTPKSLEEMAALAADDFDNSGYRERRRAELGRK